MTFKIHSLAAAGTVGLLWPTAVFAGEILIHAQSEHDRSTVVQTLANDDGAIVCFQDGNEIFRHSLTASAKLPSGPPSQPTPTGRLAVFAIGTAACYQIKNGAK